MKIANKIHLSFLVTVLIITFVIGFVFYTIQKDVLEQAIFLFLTATNMCLFGILYTTKSNGS